MINHRIKKKNELIDYREVDFKVLNANKNNECRYTKCIHHMYNIMYIIYETSR